MKNLMFLCLVILTIFGTSCKDRVAVNFTSVEVANQNKEVSIGEELEVVIEVDDSDGVASINIQIPVLSVDILIDEFAGEEKWNLNEKFEIGNTVSPGDFSVIVTINDMVGEEYVETENFTIN